MQDYSRKYIIGIVTIVLIIIGAVLYYNGFRIGTFGIAKVGKVEMTIPFMNTDIFVDNSEKITTNKDNQLVVLVLSPKVHQIIVSKTGYYPWTKKIKVPSSGMVTLSPIFVLQNPSGEYITTKDPQYTNIKNSVIGATLPTKDNPKISKDGTVSIWVENNTIVAKVNGQIHTVIAPEPVIKNLDFYKNRNDAVLFSAGDSIFVIEIDANKDAVQNIMPVFKGKDPRFVVNDANSIYIWDSGNLMQLVI